MPREPKIKLIKGFTEKYNVDKLIYYEQFDYIDFSTPFSKQNVIPGTYPQKKWCMMR